MEDEQKIYEQIRSMYKIFEFEPEKSKDFGMFVSDGKLSDQSQENSNPQETYQEDEIVLFKQEHAKFVMKTMMKQSGGMVGQDGGQPWFLFWNTQSLELLGLKNMQLDEDMKQRCISYLRQCRNQEEGGFRGAPFAISHVASTYAAIMAIVNIATEEAYQLVDVQAMNKFLISIKNNFPKNNFEPNVFQFQTDQKFQEIDDNNPSKYIGTIPGCSAIHNNGEMDIRGVYCSLVCSDILGILKDNKELIDGVGNFLIGCQTYEGGFCCSPYGEAHGGYTFCALASLIILSKAGDQSYKQINYERLLEWLSNRQLSELGGFNGRINKLIDSCYSYWVGACFELIDILLQKQGKSMNLNGEFLFNQEALQGYIILCCQQGTGGLKDKPSKGPDIYHTCYSLSGLSISQNKENYSDLYDENTKIDLLKYSGAPIKQFQEIEFEENKIQEQSFINKDNKDHEILLSGNQKNILTRINPIYNGRFDKIEKARKYFEQNNK